MTIKRNIIFSLENRKRDSVLITENVPIRMRVSYDCHRVEFTTGYRIDVAKWDASKQRVKNGCTNKLMQSAAEINADLANYASALHGVFKDFEVRGKIPTPSELKASFSACFKTDVESNEPVRDFYRLFDDFVREESQVNSWTLGTMAKFSALRNHLSDFDNGITLDSFTDKRMNEYLTFLRDVKGMRNSTLNKQVSFLKWFLRWAFRKGHTTNRVFDTFNPKLKTTQKRVIFLTWQELTKLREFAIPETKQYLERVRDVFLFTCFTGLRYSDAYNLRRSDIRGDKIHITTVKTADSLTIELNDHSRKVLERYKDVRFDDDKALPVISNQRMNDYLKELCELAGIDEPVRNTYYKGNERIDEVFPKWKLIGTHAGRRTFICNALALGIPAQVVMKWTGHSDYKAMKPYIDVADEVKASAMGKFNRL